MRRAFVFFLLTLFSHVHALYLGNPSDPALVEKGIWTCEDAIVDLSLGYQTDYDFNRRVKTQHSSEGKVSPLTVRMNQGVMTFSALNRVEAYASFGVASFEFNKKPAPGQVLTEFQTKDQFTWGLGGRLIVVEWKEFALGIEGSYQKASMHFHPTMIIGVDTHPKAAIHYHEWQVGFGGSMTIDIFVPYAAVKYSHFAANVTAFNTFIGQPKTLLKLRSKEHFGLVLGCSLAATKVFDINIEARLFDEEGVSAAGNLKF